MLVLISVYMIQNLISVSDFNDQDAAAKNLLAITLQVIVLAGLLNWKRRPERFSQTLSALAAVGIVFRLITWALLTQLDEDVNQSGLALAYFTVFFWSLFVDANIYKHALSVTLSIGMLISVLTLAVSYVMIEMLFMGAT